MHKDLKSLNDVADWLGERKKQQRYGSNENVNLTIKPENKLTWRNDVLRKGKNRMNNYIIS